MKLLFYYKSLILISVSLLTSCATPVYKMYEGEALPENKLATLINSQNEDVTLYVDWVDGKRPPEHAINKQTYYGSSIHGGFRVLLKPGKHTASIRLSTYESGYSYSSKKNREVEFTAEAGKTYTPNATHNKITLQWNAWVEEFIDKPDTEPDPE